MTAPAVLDASAAVRVVAGGDRAEAILRCLEGRVVCAPSLFVAETANALWKLERAGMMAAEELDRHLSNARALVDELVDPAHLVSESLREAVALRHPVYDLLYLVLARRIDGELISLDRRLIALAGRMAVEVAPLEG
jgi:predicted nucleic acid-binding protein